MRKNRRASFEREGVLTAQDHQRSVAQAIRHATPVGGDETTDQQARAIRRAQHVVDAARHTVSLGSSRAMLIAGFAYYEIGRFGGFGRDPAYAVLMTGSLVLSLLSASVAGFFSAFLNQHDDLRRRAAFASGAIWISRSAWRYYLASTTLYMAGITRVGFQYYGASAALPYKLAPAVLACAAMFAYVRCARHVIQTFMALEAEGFSREAQGKGASENQDKDQTSAPTPPPASTTSVADGMHHKGSAIATMSVFIVGFAQAGVTRFVPPPAHASTAASGGATVFLLATSVSFACAAFSSVVITVILVFLYDLEGAQKKERFAVAVSGVYRWAQGASLVALLSLNTSFSFVGWGCGYTALQSIPAVLGYCALVLLCWAALKLLYSVLQLGANEDTSEAGNGQVSLAIDQLENQLQAIAVRSTISAGYVFYHVASFATDIADYQGVGQAFLATHSAAFAFGLSASTVAQITGLCFSSVSNKLKLVGAVSHLARLTSWLFWTSLLLFVAGFGLFGVAKRHGMDTTIWLAIISVSVFVAAVAKFHVWCGGTDGADGVDAGARARHRSALEMYADHAFFFGAFGYFAVLFLPGSGWLTQLYCLCMGGSFCVALTLVGLVTLISVLPPVSAHAAQLAQLRAGFRFAHSTAVSLFLFGFCMLGATKSWERKEAEDFVPETRSTYAALVVASGATLVVCAGCANAWLARQLPASRTQSRPQRARRFSFMAVESSPLHTSPYELAKEDLSSLQSQSSFAASNVFFEVLFANTARSGVLNLVYFGASSTCFCASALVVAAASGTLTRLEDSGPAAAQPVAQTVAQRLTILNAAAQLAWMVAVTATAPLKYEGLWAVSVVWGATGCGVVVLHFVHAQALSKRTAEPASAHNPLQAGAIVLLEHWIDIIAISNIWWTCAGTIVVLAFIFDALVCTSTFMVS